MVVMPGPNSLNASLVGAKTVKGPIPDSFMHGTLGHTFSGLPCGLDKHKAKPWYYHLAATMPAFKNEV